MKTDLNFRNFFGYYLFHPGSKKLSSNDQFKAKVAAVALGIFTVGFGHLFSRVFFYDKKFKYKPNDPEIQRLDPVRDLNAKKATPNELLIPFYQGTGKDNKGRSLEEIWQWDDGKKESAHDYIQWLFPLSTHSAHNPNAPVLTRQLVEEMKKDKKVIANMQQSFIKMMQFYGLLYDKENKTLSYANHFQERAKVWITPGNHNFLRLTRILTCLRQFGLHDEAQALFNQLTEIKDRYPVISQQTYTFWQNAMKH